MRFNWLWAICLACFFFLLLLFAAFLELVHSSNGTTQKGKESGVLQDSKQTVKKSSKRGGRKNASIVPSHFMETDVSDVKEETLLFSKMMFCILCLVNWLYFSLPCLTWLTNYTNFFFFSIQCCMLIFQSLPSLYGSVAMILYETAESYFL